MISVAATLALMLAQGPVPVSSSDDELSFGVRAAQRGLWTEARFRFERAVTLAPDNPKALNDLAVALEEQGEFQKAREAYDKALKLRPHDEQIQQNYDLFREADEKRNRKGHSKTVTPAATAAPTDAAAPAATPTPAAP